MVDVRVFHIGLLPPSARKPELIRRACQAAFKAEKSRLSGELNVVFLNRAQMLQMNRRFLKHGHDTDVIAFLYNDKGRSAVEPFPDPSPLTSDPCPLGDVYISAYQLRIQAKALGHSALEETLTLVIHGALHLLGYDDKTPAQKARMFRRQDSILRALL